ncbi:KinB-signaling pathway activation protein [Aquibacillus sp. 3ASR75-11]|uniref:KinB-signaling pathway activation protein n=1 Tax=Terrihalobacillus insolitus TaxID=2950438 RepID=A0A9X4AML0_9BACI|nr:KinB-signaling pathway activation protein [Terrihalobacillus insolitus]MDC3414603.1 KinB-signaling pathway activation protein [Terrihalobacillus insolitus]MDC3425557.1 KinB-signaling pathway activation protein [Terrihalobacillus insolitus]
MNSRNWVRMFLVTLLLGAVATLLTSFFVKTNSYMTFLQPFDLIELLGIIVYFTSFGLVFSLISQMGFFAYLTVNQFGLGIFRGFWTSIQVVLIVFTLFDLVYFRYLGNNDEGLLVYIVVAIFILCYGWLISWIKAKETNQKAFIPALFFMIVVTSVEWVPGLRTNGGDYAWLMIVPLLVCNTYQLLILHRITNKVNA